MILEVARALPAAVRAPETVQDRRAPRRSWTGFLSMVLLLAAMLTVLVVRRGIDSPDVAPPVSLVVLTVLAWLPLLVRVSRPRLALVGTVAAESLHVVLIPVTGTALEPAAMIAVYQPVPLATMVAAWGVASRIHRGWAWGTGGGAVLLAVGVVAQPLELLVTDLVMFNVVLLAAAIGGAVSAGRERGQRRERERQEEVRSRVTDERLRIARDLHDVLAHHLALVNAQAGVAAYLVRSDPATAATALDDMARHTRQALDGLRATVGLLRREGTDTVEEPEPELGPAPEARRIVDLVGSLRAAGRSVTLDVTGPPAALDPAADLAAYRIVQEALTNATKHAPGAPVAVTLEWSAAELRIGVRNGPPPVPPTEPAPGTGHGLLGMRERARASGGTLEIERPEAGGFVVRATIPTDPHEGSTAP